MYVRKEVKYGAVFLVTLQCGTVAKKIQYVALLESKTILPGKDFSENLDVCKMENLVHSNTKTPFSFY